MRPHWRPLAPKPNAVQLKKSHGSPNSAYMSASIVLSRIVSDKHVAETPEIISTKPEQQLKTTLGIIRSAQPSNLD